LEVFLYIIIILAYPIRKAPNTLPITAKCKASFGEANAVCTTEW